jgi:hypothetical protein
MIIFFLLGLSSRELEEMRKFIFLQRVKILNVLYPGEECTKERGNGAGEAIDFCQPMP